MSREAQQRARLAHPGLARLWTAARRRIESDPATWQGAVVSIPSPDEAERAELRALTGSSGGRAFSIALADLDRLLRDGPAGLDLCGWLSLTAPLRDRPAERQDRADRLAAADAVLRQCRHADAPWFSAWAEGVRAAGQLRRLDNTASDALRRAVAVLDRLPGRATPRMQLAVEATGDPKCLEAGPVATFVLGALAAWFDTSPPEDAASTRALWEAVDVLSDDLASQVRVLGLRPPGDDPLSAWLRAAADLGHPVVLTRADVDRMTVVTGDDVFACENPSVLVAATRALGARCPPLLCANGRPHAAFWALADRLVAAGATLRYHGDLDPVGLDITAQVVRRTAARPWRMGVSDYEAAVRPDAPPWTARVALRSPWDPALAARMAQIGRPVFEEQVVEALLADLGDRRWGVMLNSR